MSRLSTSAATADEISSVSVTETSASAALDREEGPGEKHEGRKDSGEGRGGGRGGGGWGVLMRRLHLTEVVESGRRRLNQHRSGGEGNSLLK